MSVKLTSVFTEIENLCKARQTPLGQIRASGRHRSLCHTHKSLSHNKRADIQHISHCLKIRNWVKSSTSLMIALCVCVSGQRKVWGDWSGSNSEYRVTGEKKSIYLAGSCKCYFLLIQWLSLEENLV